MMMASEIPPSRLSSPAEQPRPPVPSRTSSLNYRRPGPGDKKGNLSTRVSSATAKTLAETPDLSWGHVKAVRYQSLIAVGEPLLEITSGVAAAGLRRSYSSKDPSRGIKLSRRSASCSATMRSPMRTTKVKRWAGLTRTVSDWDGLRRDPELWFDDGDCFVHLYARGQSRRGPSFCVPFKALRQNKCGAMFSLCFAQTTPTPGIMGKSTRRVSSGFTTPVTKINTVELYIPAPEDASKEASFQWHITTRNFFAFIFGKPLVGSHLGQALVDLNERMQLFRSGQIDNRSEFLEYAENQGYRDFVDCADYALAMVYYAEHFKLRNVWIDAFVHCVGMNESLTLSQEFEPISRLTKALITRASLEMDIHLGRVQVALSHFLQDDFSPTFLGLSDGGRAHLDRFRSFLHSFYVEKFGYWPPPKGVPFSKVLYQSMYYDFQNLYDYLVDLESTADLATQKPASGGVCVLQNVESFDKRHDFIALPHPLPLLPQYEPLAKKTQSQKALRTLTLGTKQAKTERYMTMRVALTAATNSCDILVTSCAIVQAYVRFERQCALNQREEKVSMTDARKIRWLLIYGTLQYLISAIRAPKEVRDTNGPEYPLCCLVTEDSPWQVGTKVLISPGVPSVNVPETINNYLSESSEFLNHDAPGPLPASSIQPDCQTDDYFTHTNPDVTPIVSRPMSVEVPAPLRIATPVVRNSSIRSLKHLSLSARSSRRNSVTLNPPQPYCEILVQGYGNGLNEAVVDLPSQVVSRTQSVIRSKRSSNSTLPEGAGPETSWLRSSTPDQSPSHGKRPAKLDLKSDVVFEQTRTPYFESFQMDRLVSPAIPNDQLDPSSSSDSAASTESPLWSDGASSTSSKSSTRDESIEQKNSAEDSGLLGGLVRVDTPVTSPKRSPTLKTASPVTANRSEEFRFSFSGHSANQFDIHQFDSSPSSTTDLTIGVALSGPMTPSEQASPPSPVAALSIDILPIVDQRPRRPLSRSFSLDPLPPLSPLRMNPPNPPDVNPITGSKRRKGGMMDIFSALSLIPNNEAYDKEQSATGRPGSECSKSILEAIPPPISKTPKIDTKKVVEEAERGRKKNRRKSFWRR